MFKRINKWLLAILIIGAILRFWGLGESPPHLTNDEAALGYNAYSILQTGRDEHGSFLPIVFQSFGDWKPGLYVYLDVPFVALLGLNEFSTRLPGAISGVIAIFLIYLTTSLLFENKKIALFSAFFLAISPWHLQFSRGAWESAVSFTLTLAGIYYLLRAIQNGGRGLILSAMFFALTLSTYQGAKISTLIILLPLLLLNFKKIIKFEKQLLIKSFLVGLLVASPVLISILQGKAGRLEVYSVFSYDRPAEYVQNILDQDGISKNSLEYYLYHSERFNFLRGILGRWTNHYSARFLFFEGDWSSKRHTNPHSGELLFVDILLIIVGGFAISKSKNKKEVLLIGLFLLFTPMSAALTRESVHAVRTINMLIPLSIISAFGIAKIIEKKRILIAPVLLLYILSFVYYLDAYWVHAPMENAKEWHYGYKQIVEKILPLQGQYKEIIVQQSYNQPYIFFLFFGKYPPRDFQSMTNDVFVPSKYGDVGLVSSLGNITFRDINWRDDRGKKGTIFVVDSIKAPVEDSSDPKEFKQLDQIKFPNGQVAFRIVEVLK